MVSHQKNPLSSGGRDWAGESDGEKVDLGGRGLEEGLEEGLTDAT